MTRVVAPEILDGLAPDDPEAIGSRRDLRRINALMGNARTVAGLLSPSGPRRILEIGAGDGAFLLRVVRRLEGTGTAWLVDRQTPPPGVPFERFGWNVERIGADAFAFLRDGREAFDAVVANLFLHHFEDEPLRELLGRVAGRTGVFVACEPRRSPLALAGTRTLGLIGCTAVTRHDARVSVLAGFSGREISELWPASGWSLTERAAGPFGHAFRAERKG